MAKAHGALLRRAGGFGDKVIPWGMVRFAGVEVEGGVHGVSERGGFRVLTEASPWRGCQRKVGETSSRSRALTPGVVRLKRSPQR